MSETPTNDRPRGAGRVAFLANKKSIQTKLDAGHSLRSIYDEFEGGLGIGYPAFTKYVKRYLRQKEETDGLQHAGRSGAVDVPLPFPPRDRQPEKPAAIEPSATKGGRLPGFHHDPDSSNRDDLV